MRMIRSLSVLTYTAGILASLTCSPGQGGASFSAYPLDTVGRVVPEDKPLPCARDAASYDGTKVRYRKPVRVNEHFKERLVQFETILEEVAVAHYGRSPARIRHLGSYNCRRIRGWPDWISEHGLANAVDIESFEFNRVPRSARKKTARRLRKPFKVSVEKHWSPTSENIHARFLRALTDRLIEEGTFRVMLGPGYNAGHKNHFHFDMSPYAFIKL